MIDHKAAQSDLDRLFALETDIPAARIAASRLGDALAAATAELDRMGRLPPLSRVPLLMARRDELEATLAEHVRQVDVLAEASRRNLDNQEQAAADGDIDMAALQGERGLEIEQWQAENQAGLEAARAALDALDAEIEAARQADDEAAALRLAKEEEIAGLERETSAAEQLVADLEAERDEITARLALDDARVLAGDAPSIFRTA